jgi:hypothetical protein
MRSGAAHGDPGYIRLAQQCYGQARAAHDPGGAMFVRLIGAAWVAGYTRAFLFRLGP